MSTPSIGFENLPAQLPTSASAGGSIAEADFTPSAADVSLVTEVTTAEVQPPALGGSLAYVGYLQTPPGFKEETSTASAMFRDGEWADIIAAVDSEISHEIVLTYKLTDAGSDVAVSNVPAGGAQISVILVDENDNQVGNAISSRKSLGGAHANIIYKDIVTHSNGDNVRMKFIIPEHPDYTGVGLRLTIFGINWRITLV